MNNIQRTLRFEFLYFLKETVKNKSITFFTRQQTNIYPHNTPPRMKSPAEPLNSL